MSRSVVAAEEEILLLEVDHMETMGEQLLLVLMSQHKEEVAVVEVMPLEVLEAVVEEVLVYQVHMVEAAEEEDMEVVEELEETVESTAVAVAEEEQDEK